MGLSLGLGRPRQSSSSNHRGVPAPLTIVTDLGGHGVVAVYEGPEPGPTVMFRAELDGLPIEEISAIPHRSTVPGISPGHDGCTAP